MRGAWRAATAGLDREVVLLSLTSLVIMLGASVMTPVLPLYAREFGVTYAGAGVMVSAFAIGRLAFDWAGGALADRTSPRLLATTGALTVALAAFLSANAPSFAWLIAFRVLEGIGSALYVITVMALFARTVPAERMGQAMGFYQSQILLGVSLGPTIGGLVAESFGLRAPFLVMSAFAVLVAALSYVLVSPARDAAGGAHGPRPPFAKMLSAIATRGHLFLLALTLFVFASRAGLRTNLIPLFGGEIGGLSASAIGLVLSVSALANFAVLWHAGALIDRRGRMAVAMPSLAATALACAAFAISPSFVNLTLSSLVLGIALGYLAPAPAAMAADLTPREMMGGMMGVYRMSGDLGLLLGPASLGWVATHGGFTAAFLFAAAAGAAVFLLGLGVPDSIRREVPSQV